MKIYLTFASMLLMLCFSNESIAQTSISGSINRNVNVNINRNISSHNFSTHSRGNGEEKEYKVAFSSGTLNLIDIDDVRVEAYDGNEVVITTLVEASENNERAAGLKLVNSLGLDDNTGFGISVSKEGNMLTARQLSGNCNCNEVVVKVPKAVSLSISHRSHSAENIVVNNVTSELEVSTNHHNVKLNNVTGPMAVKSVHGRIEATFTEVNQGGSVSLYSAHDLVDVTIPGNAKLNVNVSAPYGDVYSNTDINVTRSKTNSHSSCGTGSTIEGTVNGGGVEFNVKSAHDDVYLRQGGK